MTIAATYFQCREDDLYYPDPVWYGENYTVLMDEDDCFIWVTPGTDPHAVLKDIGIEFGGVTQESKSSRFFSADKSGKGVYKDSITYRFALKGKIPKSDSKKNGRTQEYLLYGKKGKRA